MISQTNSNLSAPLITPRYKVKGGKAKPWKIMTLPRISIRIPDSQAQNFLFRGAGKTNYFFLEESIMEGVIQMTLL